MCKQRKMGARQLPVEDAWIGVNNSRLTTCALELNNSVFSALELDHSN